MGKHAGIFVDKGAGVGKTRRVTAQGSAAGRNDIMLYAIVQAESHEAASKMFEDHPHLGIPQSSIEIMEISCSPRNVLAALRDELHACHSGAASMASGARKP